MCIDKELLACLIDHFAVMLVLIDLTIHSLLGLYILIELQSCLVVGQALLGFHSQHGGLNFGE